MALFSFKVEEKSSISPLVAGLRKDVQALITEVSCTKMFGLNNVIVYGTVLVVIQPSTILELTEEFLEVHY